MLKAFLFDLDGTLLQLSFSEFLPRYFNLIRQTFQHIFPDKNIVEMIIASSQKMLENDGHRTNEELFWNDFTKQTKVSRAKLEPIFKHFYTCNFPSLGEGITAEPNACKVIQKLKKMKLKVALATNAVFPRLAIEERLRWANINSSSFDFISSYETMNYCKPNPGYFNQVAKYLKEEPERCLMIGNDVDLDLKPADAVGMKTYLVVNNFQETFDANFKPTSKGTLAEIVEIALQS